MATRGQQERELARALSRHVGYTTGAFSLERLSDIAQLFERPFAYQFDLVKKLELKSQRPGEDRENLSEEYAADILNICVALGIIERIDGASGPKLARYKLSGEALTLKAAKGLGLKDLHDLVLTVLLLEHDADGYGLLLDILDKSPNVESQRGKLLAEMYLRRTRELRAQRVSWLHDVFRQSVLIRRIAENVPWIHVSDRGKLDVLQPKADFGRHHATPRRGWATYLRHVNDDGTGLSTDGRSILRLLLGESEQYTWLGPREGTLKALGIQQSKALRGPSGPAWELMRPGKLIDSSEVPATIKEEVVTFMREAYPHLRLVHANQAPMLPVLHFIYFLERQSGRRIDTKAFLENIFKENAEEFAPLSGRTEKMMFYLSRRS